jgi:hypothetical protein
MTYDRTGHPLARPAGMVGCMSIGVNNLKVGQRRNKKVGTAALGCSVERSSTAFLSPARKLAYLLLPPRESDRAIIPVRLRIYEAACDISAGESRD